MAEDSLDEILIQGVPMPGYFNVPGTFDELRNLYSPLTPQEYFWQQQPDSAFAPPMPVVLPELPEVVVRPRVPVPSPRPFIGPLIGAAARAIPWLFGLLIPLPAGPRELDEAPMQPVAPPRPPPPRFDVPLDPILPPNWHDLAYEPFDFGAPGLPLVPFPRIAPVVRPGDQVIALPSPWFDDFPVEVPFPEPFRLPAPQRRADPLPAPNPWEFASPLPALLPAPQPSPVPTPTGAPAWDPFTLAPPRPELTPRLPTPRPRPGNPPRPVDYFGPTGDPSRFAQPMPLPQPRAQPQPKDPCQCTETKPKKRKPKAPREVCYRGTYIERSKSLSKTRKEIIPCQ